ncbi:MAG TPA: serine/threonine-protein kinase [Luteimonas sp.]|nr:serine/threonine-protein kinase [Luteimonas sp.]HRO26434.1 serine/threonine-protein kinase [Luteimonas sp.]HRP73093.1 serine/threonine-protein kinase [Luteimonas sp.]
MSAGDTDRRRQRLSIFESVADLDPAQRARRLDELCGDDVELRAKVEAMLAADASRTEPFSGGAALWAEAMGSAAAGGGAAADAARSGEQIGAWRITGLLGRGGMGAVYAVERADGAYLQQAALKRVQGGELSPSSRERFLRERQVLARLQHPHIATLLDGGFDADGDPWFVMERVDGITIDRWCDQHALGLRERVLLFLQVLDAVQYAHRNLVVHRDLKPSNLLVTPEGQVKLLDFGIARELEEAGAAATATSDRAMTLQYASPEQLHNEPVTTATDLYQLGVVLYRLLSGRHPFGIEADTPIARQLQALSGDPEPITRSARQSNVEVAARRGETPASLARALDGSLEAVVHACLRRDPATRYASAETMAADLRAWLDDRPVAAARLGRTQRARLWLRRNRVLAAAVAAVAVALVAGTGVALWQAREAREQARIAERESANARAALAFLGDTLSAASPEHAMDTEVSVRQLLDHARAELDRRDAVDPQVRQPVQRMLGELYHSLGEMKTAVALFEAGFAGVEPSGREDTLALADTLASYSAALNAAGRGGESPALAERAAAWRERFAPGDPAQRLHARAFLAAGHYYAGDRDQAAADWQAVIDAAKDLPDPPVDVVIESHQMLGGLLNFSGDYARAQQLADEGLVFADAHDVPALSPLRVNLLRTKAEALDLNGDPVAAEPVIREAIALQRQVAGDAGSRMGTLLNALGIMLNNQGRYREAIEAMQRSESLWSASADSPTEHAIGLNNLASVYESAGDYGRALSLFEQCMTLLDGAGLAEEDATRRKMARSQARSLALAGRFTDADARLRRLQAQAREFDGEVSVEHAMVTWQRAVLARRMRDPAQGEPLLAQSRALWSELLPQAHPIFAHALRMQAAFEGMRGDHAAAERTARAALERFEASGALPVDMAVARAELAGVLLERGDRAEARRLLDQAMPVLRDAVLPQEVSRADAEALAKRLGA